eukprot:12883967-Prorocentrum_lima.AAC.1
MACQRFVHLLGATTLASCRVLARGLRDAPRFPGHGEDPVEVNAGPLHVCQCWAFVPELVDMYPSGPARRRFVVSSG